MNTLVIPVQNLLLFMAIIIVPALFFMGKRKSVAKDLVISVIRMALQLWAVGFYLQFLFEKNSALLNVAWVIIMIMIANSAILKRAGLKRRILFPVSFVSMMVSISFVGFLLLKTVGVTPLYDAPYLIPLIGMLLGNALQGNIISLERFYHSLKKDRPLYEFLIANGQSRSKALTSFTNQAIYAAITPAIGGMMTMGLVSLPGMMTGQILGGTVPIEAIKYQIVIMVAIFSMLFFSVLINVTITPLISFDKYDLLRDDIFRE